MTVPSVTEDALPRVSMPVASSEKYILLKPERETVVEVPFSLMTMLPEEKVMVSPEAVNDCSAPLVCCTVRNL